MKIDNILTKIDNMFLGLNGKQSLLSKLSDIFVIKDNRNTNTTLMENILPTNNSKNNYTNLKKQTFEEICKLPAELRFIKDESFGTEYRVQFLNKFISSNNSEWWTFPNWYSSGVTVDKLWSIYEKGGYGPYSSDVYKVRFQEIEYIKARYKTMKEVYDYIMEIRKKQLEWRKRKRENENLPNIIQ